MPGVGQKDSERLMKKEMGNFQLLEEQMYNIGQDGSSIQQPY